MSPDFSLGVVLLHLLLILLWQYNSLSELFEAMFQRVLHLIGVITRVRGALFMSRPEKRQVQVQLLRRELAYLEQDLAQLALEEMAVHLPHPISFPCPCRDGNAEMTFC